MMHLHIDSATARAYNDAVRAYAADNPDHPDFALRDETWQGDVTEMTLEEIFRFFNRVEYGDDERLDEIGYDLPSLSVGDIVTVTTNADGLSQERRLAVRDGKWRVAGVGWEAVDVR